MVNLNKI